MNHKTLNQSLKKDSLAFKVKSPLPKNIKKSSLSSNKSKPKETSESLDMLEQILTLHKQLENQIAEIYQMGKEKNINVDQFFAQTTAFSAEDIAKYKASEKALLEQLNHFEPSSKPTKPLKSESKLTQERKGKTRGARNKWISMS